LPVRSTSQALGGFAVGRLDDQFSFVTFGGCRDGGQVRRCQLAGVTGDHAQHHLGLVAAEDRGGDRPQGLQAARPVAGLLVQAGVGDRHPGLGGEHHQRALVVVVELRRAPLLGQVDVAEDLAARTDRRAEERPHRRVVGREADRTRVAGDLGQAQRPGVIDQHAEDAAAHRDVPDGRPFGVADPGGDELGDAAVAAEHAQGAVPGAGDLGRQLHDALQDQGQ
jgi:hypothetical protein